MTKTPRQIRRDIKQIRIIEDRLANRSKGDHDPIEKWSIIGGLVLVLFFCLWATK